MSTGRFFRLDEQSDAPNKEQLFRYEKISLSNFNHDVLPKHSIYVALGDHKVSFFIHGLKSRGDGKSNTIWHEEIMSLPISPKLLIKDELTEALGSIINDSIKLPKSHYEYSYRHSIIPHTEPEQNSEPEGIFGYSSLEKRVLFRTTRNESDSSGLSDFFNARSAPKIADQNRKHQHKSAKPSDYMILHKRELLLDFLYDFRNTQVFKYSPNYEDIDIRLKECFLFEAIYAKCSYYLSRVVYWRHALETEKIIQGDTGKTKQEKGKQNNEQDEEIAAIEARKTREINLQKAYSKQLETTEKDWLSIIFHPNAPAQFHQSGGWLFNIEKELKAVYFNDAPRDNILGNIKNYNKEYEISKQWRWVPPTLFLLLCLAISWTSKEFWVYPYLKQRLGEGSPGVWRGLALLLSLGFFLGSLLRVQHLHRKLLRTASYRGKEEFHRFHRYDWDRSVREWIFEERYSESHQQNKTGKGWIIHLEHYEDRVNKLHNQVNNFFLQRFDLLNAFRAGLTKNLRLPIAAVIAAFVSFIIIEFFIEGSNALYAVSLNFGMIGFFFTVVCGLFIVIHKVLTDQGLKTNPPLIYRLFLLLSFLISSYYFLFKEPDTSIGLIPLYICILSIAFLIVWLYSKWMITSKEFNIAAKSPKKHVRLALVLYSIVVFISTQWLYSEPKTHYIQFLIFATIPGLIIQSGITANFNLINSHRFTFNLTLPRLLMALISTWFLLASTEELWRANLTASKGSLGIYILLLFAVITYYMHFIIRTRSPDIKGVKVFERSSIVLFVGYSISIFIGIAISSTIGISMMQASSIIEDYDDGPIPELVRMEAFQKQVEQNNLAISEFKAVLSEEIFIEFLWQDRVSQLWEPYQQAIFETQKYPATLQEIKSDIRDSYFSNCNRNVFSKMCSLNQDSLEAPNVGVLNNFSFPSPSLITSSNIKDSLQAILSEKIKSLELKKFALDLDILYQNILTYKQEIHLQRLHKDREYYTINLMNSLGLYKDIDPCEYYLHYYNHDHPVLDSTSIENNSMKYSIHIFPRILLFNSIIALFIGIFVQVATQGKSVMESL